MRLLNKICTVAIWVIPALLFGYMHLSKSGIEATFQAYPLIQNRIVSFSIATQAPLINSSLNSNTQNLLKSDKLDNLFNNLGRLLPIIKLETEILRYNLSFKNDASLKLKYSEHSTNSVIKEEIFHSLLSCEGKQIPFSQKVIIESNLYLGNGIGDSQEYIEKIISSCLENLSISAQNNTEKNLYLASTTPQVLGTISFLIQPDPLSAIFIFIGWFVAWSGFLIVVREGLMKSLR